MADDKRELDEVSGTETTGHEWDGIKELDTPMPRWWLSIFYATIVWGLVYTIAFPAWPLISSYTKGILGSSTRADHAENLIAHEESQSVWRDRIAQTDLNDIFKDQELFEFAYGSGEATFGLHCSQCHGLGANGFPGGYPSLRDDAWIWGGTPEAIYITIKHGVRNETEDSQILRGTAMPAYGWVDPAIGGDPAMTDAQIDDLSHFVLSLSWKPEFEWDYDRWAAAAGAGHWELQGCAGCHGLEGEGIPDVGAPNLSDQIWLYGGTHAEISAQIWKPQLGAMPAWGLKLDDGTIKELAVYVHSLGGGQSPE